MANIIHKDNKTYYQIYCPKCNSELLFTMTNEKRRVYGACKACMGSFDLEVPSLNNGGCKNCGTMLLDCDRYCPNCGFPNEKKNEPQVFDAPTEKPSNEAKPKEKVNINEKLTPEENQVFKKYLMVPFLMLMSCMLLSMFMMLGGILIWCSIAFALCLVSTIIFIIQKPKLKEWPKLEKMAQIFVIIGVCGCLAFLGLMIWGITLIA